jgi:drug/metabolite transporter (DMT)-like permease
LFFGFVFFGETFGTMSYVGMGLVLAGILLNLREK